MYILGVDTSCDDTSCGIIHYKNGQINILANEIESQSESTMRDGGVIPNICAGNHCENLEKVVKRALKVSGLNMYDIQIYSSVFGPGMIGSLIVGNTFIGTLASLLNKTYIPIHHIEAHISVVNINAPFLALIVSGGHSLIAAYRSFGNYEIVCNSLDDACGEVFDKIGREMGMPFPAGRYIEQLAKESSGEMEPISVMKGKLAFSFSGLKTAHKKMLGLYSNADIAYSLQESIANVLAEKLKIAVENTGIDQVVACGGVMSNVSIRNKIEKIANCKFPPIELCTDNGVMVACAALNHWRNASPMVNNWSLCEKASLSLDEWSKIILF